MPEPKTKDCKPRKRPLHHDPAALRYALDASQLTQRQLADRIGRSEMLVSYLLSGKRSAGPALLPEIAKALNCPIVVLEAKRPVVAGDAA